MPDDDSCELKHAAQKYVTFSCCVGRNIACVFERRYCLMFQHFTLDS